MTHRAYSAIANAPYEIDVPDMERLSEVAAQGREFVARFQGIGGPASKTMAELDALLAQFGLTWNPRPRPFARRTAENRHPFRQAMEDARQRRERETADDHHWNGIVRGVATIERVVGTATAILENIQGRDSMQGISVRLAFLTGYLESRFKRDRETIDITPDRDQDDGEYETAGNLICLPGVKLVDVQPNDGGRA